MRILGTKEDQKKEIIENFQPYADLTCRDCLGSGEIGWVENEHRYRICSCVYKKIQKEEVVN